MERTVLKYAPSYWDRDYEVNEQFVLRMSSEEYITIEHQIKTASKNNNLYISRIQRNQHIHDFGQFLVREQLLASARPYENFYRVRRFTTIKKQFLANALEYNLDHRRCGKSSLLFSKYIPSINDDEVILVVVLLTSTPNSDHLEPTNSSDYFIDYIVNV